MLDQLDQLEHMKKWALQDQSALSKEQLCQSFAAMCDDAIAELQAVEHPLQTDACWFCHRPMSEHPYNANGQEVCP